MLFSYLFFNRVNRVGRVGVVVAAGEVFLEADDVDVAAEFVILAVGTSRLDDVEIDTGFHEFAAISSVPAFVGVGKLGDFNAVTVINPAMEVDD